MPKTPPPPQWRNRIVDYGEMSPQEFARNPRNPKIHGAAQRSAVSALLDDVGWVAPLVVNRTTGLLLDGHMRLEEAATKGPIPVAYVELTEAEETEVLALMDPIGAMAGHDADAIAELIAGLDTTVDLEAVGLLAASAGDPVPFRPQKVTLKPLRRAFVLITVPLDQWANVAGLLDQMDEVAGVEITSTTSR